MKPAEKIADILREVGITMIAQHVPTTFDPKSKDWQHVAWSVTFKSSRGEFTTSYRQGLGHLPNYPKGYNVRMSMYVVEEIRYTLKTGKIASRPGNTILPGGKPLPPPDVADVVSSLILDSQAADYAKFEDYASDTGMNPDSIKDFKIWEACRDIALQLNRVFGAAVVESLREPCSEL